MCARRQWRVAAAALVLGALALALCATADCPSNGNTNAIYVTSNMGDNVWSFDSQGAYIGEVLDKSSFPADVQVDKLRSMRFGPGGHLYLSSARGSYSRVFAVSGNGLVNGTLQANCTRRYLFTATAQSEDNPFLDHPYDMLFHPITNDLYVSNQNSVTVTRYAYNPEKNGAPAWTPASNAKTAMPAGKVDAALAATAAANINNIDGNGNGNANDDHTTMEETYAVEVPDKIPGNSGLFASGWTGRYTMNSVRGMALSPRLPISLVDGTAPPGLFTSGNDSMAYYLLVCDVTTNTVHVFDADTGARLFGLWVPSPVQVMFPARYYSAPAGGQADGATSGASMQRYEQPYVLVTSKEDAVTYMVRFSSHSSGTGGAKTSYIQNGIYLEDGYTRSHRLQAVTQPTPMHAGSGIYENPSRDILLVADRNGRRVSSYASPAAYTGGDFPLAAQQKTRPEFLGYFVKRLPDQPEFILSVTLEQQRNVPFCYELSADGTLRYVALCTAAYIWSIVLGAILLLVPLLLLYQQGQHYLRERRRQARLQERQKREAIVESPVNSPNINNNSAESPLLRGSTGQPSYGATS